MELFAVIQNEATLFALIVSNTLSVYYYISTDERGRNISESMTLVWRYSDDPGFNFRQGHKIDLFSKTSLPPLGPT
jgi:hypothetical protein